MKALLTASIALSIGLVCANLHADVIWIGGGVDPNKLFEDGNWDLSGSPVSMINMNTPILDNVRIENSTLNCDDFSSFGASSNGYMAIGDGFRLTVDNTSFSTDGTGGISGFNDGGDIVSDIFFVNGTDVGVHFVANGAKIRVDGTSSLTIRATDDAIDSSDEATGIYIDGGGMLTMNSVSAFSIEGDEIFAPNAEGIYVSFNSDNSILSITGNTGTANFTAVPEPTSGLLAFSSLVLLLRTRRRRTKAAV